MTLQQLEPAIPEVEAKYVGRLTDNAITGGLIWATTFRQIMVITIPQSVRIVLRRVMAELGQYVNIIPAIKTSPVLGNGVEEDARIDNPAGWARVAQAAHTACSLTGSDWVLIENEGGWKPYLRGEYEPDWDRVQEGLQNLAGLNMIWYPTNVFADPMWNQRAVVFMGNLCLVHSNLRVVTQGWSTRNDERNKLAQERQTATEKVFGSENCINIFYMYGDPQRPQDWKPAELPIQLAKHNQPTLICPGYLNWQDAAVQCCQAMRR
jgi:hypothetical protein